MRGRSYIPQRPGRRWTVWIIPSWAIGTAFIIVVVAAAQVVVRRLVGRADRSAGQNPTEPDVARLAQALDDVHHRLGELERSEEHTSELQSPCNLVCRLLLEKKKTKDINLTT